MKTFFMYKISKKYANLTYRASFLNCYFAKKENIHLEHIDGNIIMKF